MPASSSPTGCSRPARTTRVWCRWQTNLAACGFAVLVPELDGLKSLRLEMEESDDIVAAFRFLLSMDEVDDTRSGLFGISFAAGPILKAAADPSIRERGEVRGVLRRLLRHRQPGPLPDHGPGRISWPPARPAAGGLRAIRVHQERPGPHAGRERSDVAVRPARRYRTGGQSGRHRPRNGRRRRSRRTSSRKADAPCTN